MGCRPTDWNKVAAIGNRMIYPASPTILDNSPKTMTSRIMRQGSRGRRTPLRIHASMKPECCATPIPNHSHNHQPNGANPVKLVMTWRSSQRMPSGLSRLCTPYFFSSLRLQHAQTIDIEYP